MAAATLGRFTENAIMLDNNKHEPVKTGGTCETQLDILDDSPKSAAQRRQQQPSQNFSWMPCLSSMEIGSSDASVNETPYDPMSIESDLMELSRGQLDTFLTTDWLSYYENSDNWVNDEIIDTCDGV